MRNENNGRIIGIRHRIKATAEGEARPTQIAIRKEYGDVSLYDLSDEQAELDFLRGVFPVSFRSLTEHEGVTEVEERYLKMRVLRAGEDPPKAHLKIAEGKRYRITHVADQFDGLQESDTVAMTLGGSGDYFAYALARRGEEIGARVMRVPPFVLKEYRQDDNKGRDAELLAELAKSRQGLFYELRVRDMEIIRLREAFNARQDAMKARIACEQRLRQHFIGSIFCNHDGYFPEGAIEKLYDERKANDVVYMALVAEEKARARELQKIVESSDVWRHVFSDIEGMGWAIAARIIAGIVDIRRFENASKFKAFCGVHVLSDGRFARLRSGEVANWHPDLRQALYLFGDQMNRRPDSIWGKKLREYKVKFREKYPESVVGENGKRRYGNAHIHKMAMWRTLTKFAELLFREWSRLERDAKQESTRYAA